MIFPKPSAEQRQYPTLLHLTLFSWLLGAAGDHHRVAVLVPQEAVVPRSTHHPGGWDILVCKFLLVEN